MSAEGMPEGIQDCRDVSRQVVNSRVIYEGAIFDLRRDEIRLYEDGNTVVRDYLDHPGAVGIVALRGERGAEEVAVVRQYRHPVRARLWEVPAGLRDMDGEDPHATAIRELREEANIEADSWNVLVDIVNSPGSTNEGLRIFLARGVRFVEHDYEREHEEAEMEVRWVPLDELAEGLMAGRLHNTTLAVGVLAAVAARAQGWSGLRPADAPWEISGRAGGR